MGICVAPASFIAMTMHHIILLVQCYTSRILLKKYETCITIEIMHRVVARGNAANSLTSPTKHP